MKTAILIALTLASRCLAADAEIAKLPTREYRVPFAFLVWLQDTNRDPDTRLSLSGVPSAPGCEYLYIAGGERLVVRHTSSFLDALEQLATQWKKNGRSVPPDAKLLKVLRDQDTSPNR